MPASCWEMRGMKLDAIIENPTLSQLFPSCPNSLLPLSKPPLLPPVNLLTALKNSCGNALPTSRPWACSLFPQVPFNTHFLHGSLTSFFLLLFTSTYLLDSSHAFIWVSVICAFPRLRHCLPLN